MYKFKMSVGCTRDCRDEISPGNPNPYEFEITKIRQIGNNVVVKVNYPNCQNYEGNKILVIKNISKKAVYATEFLDPHFTKDNEIKPFARFEPTDEGWRTAIELARLLGN